MKTTFMLKVKKTNTVLFTLTKYQCEGMGVLKFIHIVMVYYSFHQVERLRVFNQICCAMRTHLHTMILKLRTQKIAEI